MNETTNEHETLAGARKALVDALVGAARDRLEDWGRAGGDRAVRVVRGLLDDLARQSDRLRDAQVTIRSLVGAWDPSDPATVVPNPPPGHHWTSGNATAPGRTSCLVCPAVAAGGSVRPTTATECLNLYRTAGGAR